jgi:hypothetical protein
MAKLSPLQIERRTNPSEIIRCLFHDGCTPEQGARYCRQIAFQATYNAYAEAGDAQAYTEAAERLEARARADKVALEHVEQLEALCESQGRHILELQRTILELQNG